MMDLTNEQFVKVMLQSIEGHDDELKINKTVLNEGVIATGNNYASEIVHLSVEYCTKNGIIKNENFILKTFPSKPENLIWESLGIYDKETQMYKQVLPAMEKLLDQQQEDLIFPKGYKSIYPDVLILEDLKSSGYEMMNRTKQLDFEHAAVAFKTMAKFHALSLQVNQKYPEIINKVKAGMNLHEGGIGYKTMSEIHEKSYESAIEILRKIKETASYVDSFHKLWPQMMEKMYEACYLNQSKIQVLIHGDHWLNNMMFKHDNEGNVIDSKLIDFQLSKWCSPATDIWHFVVTSVPFSIFQNHMDCFIAIYLQSLNDMLEKLGSELRFSIEDIRNELDETITFGVSMLVMVLPIVLSDPSDPIDFSQICEDSDKTNTEAFLKIHQNKQFLNALCKWFLYFNEKIVEGNKLKLRYGEYFEALKIEN